MYTFNTFTMHRQPQTNKKFNFKMVSPLSVCQLLFSTLCMQLLLLLLFYYYSFFELQFFLFSFKRCTTFITLQNKWCTHQAPELCTRNGEKKRKRNTHKRPSIHHCGSFSDQKRLLLRFFSVTSSFAFYSNNYLLITIVQIHTRRTTPRWKIPKRFLCNYKSYRMEKKQQQRQTIRNKNAMQRKHSK